MTGRCPAAFQRGMLIALVGCVAVGCGREAAGLKTYAVKGRVVYAADGQPMTAGTVTFESTTDPNRSCSGDLDREGNFTLRTIVGSRKQPGAAEGSYRVTVLPAQDASQMARPISLPETYQVQPNDANDFVLTVAGATP